MNSNRPTIQARLAKVIAGIGSRLQSVPNLVLVGVTYTPAQAIAFFKSAIDLANEVTIAKAKWQDTVKAERTLQKDAQLALLDLQNTVRALFGNAVGPLADFGFTPRKATRKRTGTTMVAMAEKAKATRTARHTMGPRKKLEVKGTVEVPSPELLAATAAAANATAAVTATPPVAAPVQATPPALPGPGGNGSLAAPATSGTPQQGPSNGSTPKA